MTSFLSDIILTGVSTYCILYIMSLLLFRVQCRTVLHETWKRTLHFGRIDSQLRAPAVSHAAHPKLLLVLQSVV